jgi:hypothetical protein
LSLELVYSCTAVDCNGRNFSRSSISAMQIYLPHFSTANQPQNVYLQFFQQNKKKETVGRSYAIFNTSFFFMFLIYSFPPVLPLLVCQEFLLCDSTSNSACSLSLRILLGTTEFPRLSLSQATCCRPRAGLAEWWPTVVSCELSVVWITCECKIYGENLLWNNRSVLCIQC